MRKIIIIMCVVGINTLCKSNPFPNPQLYLMNITIPSESNWSIKINSVAIYDSTYFDSVVVVTSKDTAVYSIAKHSLAQKELMNLSEFTLTNDSFNKPININPANDKVVITMYIAGKVFKRSENIDSVSFGTYPNAMFDSLTPIASILRTEICGGIYPLHYDNGIPCSFTIKGIIYDLNGIPVKNISFADAVYWNYTGSDPCYVGTFQTNNMGEYQTTKSCSNQKYQRSSFEIVSSIPTSVNITPISIRAVNDTIVNYDIHLINYSVSTPLIANSEFSLFPNPAGTQATLNYSLQKEDKAIAEICNIQGGLVERFPLKAGSGSLVLHLDSKYHSGIYVVRVLSGNDIIYSQQLIINK